MGELLDDHQHQNRALFKNKDWIKFEGMVPYILLDGTAVEEVPSLLEKANLLYELQDLKHTSVVEGATTPVPSLLGTMLHVREEDKGLIDEALSDYTQQINQEAKEQEKKALRLFGKMTFIFIAVVVVFGLLLSLFF